MRNRWILGTLFLVISTAHAAEPAAQAVPEKAKNHKFSDLKLKGQLKKPELSYIYKRNGLRAEKIVNIPENFNNEIIQDAGRL